MIVIGACVDDRDRGPVGELPQRVEAWRSGDDQVEPVIEVGSKVADRLACAKRSRYFDAYTTCLSYADLECGAIPESLSVPDECDPPAGAPPSRLILPAMLP
jgi:hypothetical protein